VSGGGGVEHNVVVARGGIRLGEKRGELVERGDLGRARPGELLDDGGDLPVGQQPTHRADDAFSIRLGSLFWVDLQCVQTGHVVDGGDGVADGDTQDLRDVGSWVGADQEHTMTSLRQGERGGARD